jgi:hypothetical protein
LVNAENNEDQERGLLEQQDRARTGELYAYLVGSLARANYSGRKTFEQLFGGPRSFYDSLRRASRAVTTGELAARLAHLRERCLEMPREQPKQGKLPTVLTSKDIRLAFLKLIDLTPIERDRLGLRQSDGDILMQQALLHIWGNEDRQDYERILRFYIISMGDVGATERLIENYSEDALRTLIRGMVLEHLGASEASSSLKAEQRSAIDRIVTQYSIVDLVISEVNQILLKAGVQQIQLGDVQGKEGYSKEHLTYSFLQRLTKSVTENQILTSEFPVFIDSISVEECGPFPLALSTEPSASADSTSMSLAENTEPIKRASLNNSLLGLHEYERAYSYDDDEEVVACAEIAAQHTYRVKVEFYIKLPVGTISQNSSEAYDQLKKEKDDSHEKIFFSLESTGIGGVLSHITKLINNAVLSDICSAPASEAPNQEGKSSSRLVVNLRRDYFPIAHDVMINRQFPRSSVSSPVWAHSLVTLSKRQYLAAAMDLSCRKGEIVRYTDISFGDQVGWGDYCGFDLLLCSAKAALNARLRAIKYTGIGANDYLQALYNRVESQYFLKKANIYVNSYPFSSLAQESLLNLTLLKDLSRPLTENDPYTLFVACLRIAETFIVEGAYRKAWPYLERVYTVLSRSNRWYDNFGLNRYPVSPFRVFSGSLVVRFALCLAYYFLVVDPEQESASDEQGQSLFLPQRLAWEDDSVVQWNREPTALRQTLVRRSWLALETAEKHLHVRLAKYFVINEESQGTFHPHYKYLAQIYFLRAKLFLYFPRCLPAPDSKSFYLVPTDHNPEARQRGQSQHGELVNGSLLYLLEKARLYAATDGDSERYACYTAYQSWAYIMASRQPQGLELRIRDGYVHAELSQEDCLRWARRLRDDALIGYEDIGRHCYLKLKEKSGVSERLLRQRGGVTSLFGLYQIETIPAIRETFKENGSRVLEQQGTKLLELDMSLLAVSKESLGLSSKEDDSGVIYLFGPTACHLFFARGMYHLMSPYQDEFEFCQGSQDNRPEDLQTKLREAYRLFSYAWAIADDGGDIENSDTADVSTSNTTPLKIKRSFTLPHPGGLDDVAALRDLYPLRITEIAGLGRIFAAACALFCLSLETQVAQQQLLRQDIEGLLDNLHQQARCQYLNQYASINGEAALLNGQNRYNGHLAHHFSRCRRIILEQLDQLEQAQSIAQDVAGYRDRVIDQLFAILRS